MAKCRKKDLQIPRRPILKTQDDNTLQYSDRHREQRRIYMLGQFKETNSRDFILMLTELLSP